MIDLRSDTLTKPCDAMRTAIMNADVNDDVIDVDPTVAKLQETIAGMLGKEAAMFMPSGTMTNQVAVRLHCDELICESGCHIYNYEQGGFAQLSNVVARTIEGTNSAIQLDQLRNCIHPENEHAVRTRMICLENTHNKGGGVVLPYDGVAEICSWAHENGLVTHLDGARLFNAIVASGKSASDWGQHFDTISICFSKGLGAPVGSALVGNKDMIYDMRRHRKLFGGGMRQSGFLAAAALYALENNVDRLADDHANAKHIGQAAVETDGLHLDLSRVETNIVIFRVEAEVATAAEFCEAAKAAGVWMFPFSHEDVRAVTHLHISESDAKQAGQIIAKVAAESKENKSRTKKSVGV